MFLSPVTSYLKNSWQTPYSMALLPVKHHRALQCSTLGIANAIHYFLFIQRSVHQVLKIRSHSISVSQHLLTYCRGAGNFKYLRRCEWNLTMCIKQECVQPSAEESQEEVVTAHTAARRERLNQERKLSRGLANQPCTSPQGITDSGRHELYCSICQTDSFPLLRSCFFHARSSCGSCSRSV